MDKISRLTWKPIYSLNIEILDTQRRKLFDVVNQHIDAYESGSDDFLSVIKELIDYLSFEFHQEHIAMMNTNYPDFLKHIREHQKFTEKIEEFLKDYRLGNKDLGLNMMLFLKAWISDHTTNLDVQYGQYLLTKAAKLKHPPNLNHGYEPQSKLRGIKPSAARDCSTYQFRCASLSELEFQQ